MFKRSQKHWKTGHYNHGQGKSHTEKIYIFYCSGMEIFLWKNQSARLEIHCFVQNIKSGEVCVFIKKKNRGDNVICRIFWLLICLSAVIYIFVEIRKHWVNLSLNYTRTLTKSTQHGIYYFLFPAVTICGLNKVSKKAALSLVENL